MAGCAGTSTLAKSMPGSEDSVTDPASVCILCIACCVVLCVMFCYAKKCDARFNNTRSWQNKCMTHQFPQFSFVDGLINKFELGC